MARLGSSVVPFSMGNGVSGRDTGGSDLAAWIGTCFRRQVTQTRATRESSVQTRENLGIDREGNDS